MHPQSRRSNALRFKYCVAETERPGCVAHVCGPIALLNGACADHANCVAKDFDVAEVLPEVSVQKGDELVICYDATGAVDVPGADEIGVRCGINRCRVRIIQ